MSDTVVNKVAQSGIITIDPVDFLPAGPAMEFDLKNHLFMGLILKEKDFREALKLMDWSQYHGKDVQVHCSADAIIPLWAYMLVASYLMPVASLIEQGDARDLRRKRIAKNIQNIDIENYRDKRIVIKGCGDTPIDDFIYLELTAHLLPHVKSIMYGEPCSTVPVYKKPSKSE